jgi:hypothetical protein
MVINLDAVDQEVISRVLDGPRMFEARHDLGEMKHLSFNLLHIAVFKDNTVIPSIEIDYVGDFSRVNPQGAYKDNNKVAVIVTQDRGFNPYSVPSLLSLSGRR